MLSGSGWQLKVLLFCWLFGACFSYNLEWVVPSGIPLPRAYEEKSLRPLVPVDTENWTGHEGEISHGKKINTRLAGSLLLWLGVKAGLTPYAVSSCFGLLFLFCFLRSSFRAVPDRWSAFLFCLMVTGLFASSSAFAVTFMPKPFDGIALGFLGLALLPHLGLVFLGTFLGGWTDERVFPEVDWVVGEGFNVGRPASIQMLQEWTVDRDVPVGAWSAGHPDFRGRATF